MNKKMLALLVLIMLPISAVAHAYIDINNQSKVCLAYSNGQRITADALEKIKSDKRTYVQLIDTHSKLLLPAQTYTLPLASELLDNGCFEHPFILTHVKKGHQWFDVNGELLYDVYWFDNGPDYPQNGLFRFKQNDLIGYANADTHQIVIPAQYQAAHPFRDGHAKVSYEADIKQVGDGHMLWINTDYLNINRQGDVIESTIDVED